jgi:hypothetical protein
MNIYPYYHQQRRRKMPTKTKKNPNVDLSEKLRAIMCDRIQEFVEENELDYHWEDIPKKIARSHRWAMASTCACSSWKKMGITCKEIDLIVGVDCATEMVKFSNENQGCVIVLLYPLRNPRRSLLKCQVILVCAAPLALAKKIVKKGSL